MISGRYNRLIGVAIAVLALCIPASACAVTGVDNLVLSPSGEFTELTVAGGGTTLCNHFTEPAKNGAPFRIVLDFCDAKHELGQMHFTDLPKTRIRRIRTSQFETSPKMIVRVVLDMADEATYSVVRDGKSLTVRIVDANRPTFAVWNARANSKPASQPVMAKVAPKTTQPAIHPKAIDTEPVVAQKPVTKSKPVVAQKPVTKSEPVAAQRPEPKSAPVVAQKPVAKPATQPAVAKAEPVPTKQIKIPAPNGDAEATVAVEPSRTRAFIPPKTPLVFAPEESVPVAKAGSPTVAGNEPVISKETMHPMGPTMNDPSTSGQQANNAVSKARWASTNDPEPMMAQPVEDEPVFAHDNAQQFASTTPNDMAEINEEEPLLERLKQKFFGDQAAPRPYTTVGEAMPSNDIQGPPSPNAKISREDLLARIREAQRRAANGELRRGDVGAGGVPTRAILYYDDMGRRDPFNPLVTGQRSGFVTDELPNVETLRLVGILRDDHEALALLENLEGYGYILRVGDAVKNGTLLAIQNSRALFRIDDYGWTHTVALQLTTRGTDPSKSLGAVQQEYPKYESDTEGNENTSKPTGNQGSEGE